MNISVYFSTDILLMILAVLSTAALMSFVTVAVVTVAVCAMIKQWIRLSEMVTLQPIFMNESVHHKRFESVNLPPTSVELITDTHFNISTANISHSSPINIPSGQGRQLGEYAVVVRNDSHISRLEEGDRDAEYESEKQRDGTYTIMSTST